MHVLDLGSGIGDVSLIAAKLLGGQGSVTSLDQDGVSLEIARRRAASAGLDWVSFQQADLEHHHSHHRYDAVIGRHILIHVRDPVALLRKLAARIGPRGLLAFQEGVFAELPGSHLASPTARELGRIVSQVLVGENRYADLGLRLFSLMREAGLPAPVCRMECLIDGGPDSPFYEWFAESVRSLLPLIEAGGLATAAWIDVDTLTDRLRAEADSMGLPLFAPPLVGAFTRVETRVE